MTIRLQFWLLLVATLGYAQFMKIAVQPLTSQEIVAYELARTPNMAQQCLNQLAGAGTLELMRRSLYIDFGFLLLYGLCLFVALRYAVSLADHVGASWRWVRIGGWLGIVAMATDAVENVALLQQFSPATPSVLTAGLAWTMAVIKFGAVIVTILSILIYFSYYGIRRFRQ